MNLSVDFPFILTSLVLLSGIISLIDILFLAKKRAASGKKMSWIVEYSRSFFLVLFLVWVIRSFIFQPYRVPTGSLEPTILPGDFIAVSQFSYGLRLPVIHTKILNIGEPKTGQIVLFRWPVNSSILFVKRVIGTPGDHVIYKNKVLYINGKEMKQTYVGKGFDIEPGEKSRPVIIKQENLNGAKHLIQLAAKGGETENFDIIVPKGMYFMMGDNRDDSDDSRMWGFVPEQNLVGEAFGIWMSWDSRAKWGVHKIRWSRIGKGL